MDISVLEEPELDFGVGKHIDARFGIMNFGVLDYGDSAASQIRVGIVGTRETCDGLAGWLERCEDGVLAKESTHPHLFPNFPGFASNRAFYSQITTGQAQNAVLSPRELRGVLDVEDPAECAMAAARLFDSRIRQLREDTRVDVVVCAPPLELVERTLNEGDSDNVRSFRHALKALAMQHQTPTQIVLPTTYDPAKKLTRKTRSTERSLQDEATRAWNFFTALYYKAGGVPWRMMRLSSDYATCFVGIGFYKSLDGSSVQTSVAQVFNEKGEGVVVRGGAASISKEDKHPYLQEDDARSLLERALERYRLTHGNLPARVVLHKSSPFQQGEIKGFQAACDAERISFFDAVSISASSARLFRDGDYPPLRGTLMRLSSRDAILYTKGSVEFFRTYPGMYVPDPLRIRVYEATGSLEGLAVELLALSKMNWNKTQFDGRSPITLEGAKQVGHVLKYIPEGQPAEASYRFYM